MERSKSFLRETKHVCPALGNPDHPSENRMFRFYYHPLRFPSIIKVSRPIRTENRHRLVTGFRAPYETVPINRRWSEKTRWRRERMIRKQKRIKWQRSEVRSVCELSKELRKREREREREKERENDGERERKKSVRLQEEENASKTNRKARWNPLGGVSLSVFECYLYPSSSSSRFPSIWCSLFSSFSAILLDGDGLRSTLSHFMSRYIRG